jgi:CRISPR/Cas system CSM-associated protein Csm3 (group 7 of RAMP superfamily)
LSMNPYDFVPIDPEHPPQRRRPVWHNTLMPGDAHAARLYSGHLYVYIQAETPLFIQDGTSSMQDPNYPGQHLRNSWDECIIPGSSLKGMLRTVVETLCNGCMAVFRKPQEYIDDPLPRGFSHCQDNTVLCIACRLFGMMQSGRPRPGQHHIDIFLGKVNIGDAVAFERDPDFHEPLYTAVLDGPKPRHRAFYIDEQGRYIAGRKFYFHNEDLLTEDRLIPIRNTGEYRNQYIEPLAVGTDFNARIDFTNLEADELAALLLAIELQPDDMRHKIGYGKPLGLGSVRLSTTELQLVDYSQRYKNIHAGRGITLYKNDELAALFDEQLASLDPRITVAWQHFSAQPAFGHLRRIWKWRPDKTVEYAYPGQRWFKEHPRARISDTRNLRRGD